MLTRAARPCWTPPSWGTWHHSSEQLPAKLCQQPWLGWPMLRATGAQRIIIGSTTGQLVFCLTIMHQQLLWCRVAGKRLQGTVVDTQSGKAVLELWDEDQEISIHQQLMQVELFLPKNSHLHSYLHSYLIGRKQRKKNFVSNTCKHIWKNNKKSKQETYEKLIVIIYVLRSIEIYNQNRVSLQMMCTIPHLILYVLFSDVSFM